ncbi:TPA: hypothetical protein ENS27_10975 [bacterium]|nr:hypothetical protein [bacterium]
MSYTIYQASAGSGKTTKIVQDYLYELFTVASKKPHRQELIQYIESSIGITFTNKATAEMKDKILEAIWAFVTNKIPEQYKELINTLQKNNIDVEHISKNILSLILHNFHVFNITTIDSFIQKISRSIAYELDLPLNYEVSLDSNKIISLACKRVLKKLGSNQEQSEYIHEVLENFSDYIIYEKNQWNAEQTLTVMVKALMNEQFLTIIDNFHSMVHQETYHALYEISNKINTTISKELKERAQIIISKIDNFLKNHNVTIKDIIHNNGKGNYFVIKRLSEQNNKYENDLIKESMKHIGQILKTNLKAFSHLRNSFEADILEIYSNFIQSYIIHAKDSYNEITENKGTQLLSAKAILKTYFIIALMQHILDEITAISQEEGTVLLSEFTRIMSKKLSNNDIPFIFMKLDYEIQRLFIDEFQDTSRLQWMSLSLFKENMLSENRDFFIIGDPKQAIYHWRNGDVKIMLKEIEYIEQNSNNNPKFNRIFLDTNYRSLPAIVNFNNDFFIKLITAISNDKKNIYIQDNENDQAGKKLFDNITASYYNMEQKLPNSQQSEGMVQVEFFEYQKNKNSKNQVNEDSANLESDSNTETDESEITALPQESVIKCITFIQNILNKGYKQKDIAILIRENKEAAPLIEALLKANISFTNNNALFIDTSPAVQCIISILRFMANHNDYLSLQTALQLYIQYFNSTITIEEICLTNLLLHETGLSSFSNLYNKYKDESWFTAFAILYEKSLYLKSLDLYSLTEELIRIFGLYNSQNDLIYLQFLLNYIHDFIKTNQDSISDFLDYFDSHKDKFTISSGEQPDAIQIMSIHKSKGLQFPVVIIPDANFSFKTDDYIIAPVFSSISKELQEKPAYPLLYIYKREKYLKQLKETYLPMLQSKADTIHDNINLLYVAMTRAEKVLYMLVPIPASSDNSPKKLIDSILATSNMGQLLQKTLQITNLPEILCSGSIPELKPESSKGSNTDAKQEGYQFITDSWQSKLVIKTNKEKIDIALNKERFQQISFGNLLHKLLSETHSYESIQAILTKEYYKILAPETREMLFHTACWVWKEFESRGWTHFPHQFFERGIIYHGEEKRPDCVFTDETTAIIVDYKTGYQEEETEETIKRKYNNQLETYAAMYRELGYSTVKTYIMLPQKQKLISMSE